jgi:hypothetical protein
MTERLPTLEGRPDSPVWAQQQVVGLITKTLSLAMQDEHVYRSWLAANRK